ncbi:phytanoyl-CoA dioxygenase family protein [Variovorax sp. DAIF25]|uniref:phytanoyl-CoA dioxygenase family protein n=1 Tax=Variovorax sp. DAIF25 TaxID=3080983 RepID=UPI003D6AB829
MSPTQIDHFRTHGYLHLEGFHPKPRVAPLRQKLRDELKRLAGAKGGLSAVQRLPLFQQIGKLSALVNLPGLHEALVTPALLDFIAKLGHRAPPSAATGHPGTQLLLSPPQQGDWTLQGLNWHVDLAARPQDPLPGVQAFFLIDDVAPHGGATLALAGSHRIDTRRPASDSQPALRELLKDPLDLERRLGEQGLAIVEMCGRAGDVFLMDMRVLHTPSVNATKQPRMMATTRCIFGT